MAIDVDQLIEFVLYGEGQRVSGPYYASTVFYDPETPLVPYDPDGAERLLAEAGFRPGPDGVLAKDGQRLAFKLITNNGNPSRRAIMTIAQDAWKKLGVDVVTQAFEWTVFLEEFVNPGEFDAVVLGWSGGALDPDLFQIWHSSQAGKYQLNFAGYRSAEADRLIERSAQADPEAAALAHGSTTDRGDALTFWSPPHLRARSQDGDRGARRERRRALPPDRAGEGHAHLPLRALAQARERSRVRGGGLRWRASSHGRSRSASASCSWSR
jgi:hypothetical protein